MIKKTQALKEKLESEIEEAKERLYQIKTEVQNNKEKWRAINKEKQKEIKLHLAEMQQEADEKKAAFEESIEVFLTEHSVIAAKKKADNAREYATSCISLAFAAIEEAQMAMHNAITAAEQAEKMENEAKLKI